MEYEVNPFFGLPDSKFIQPCQLPSADSEILFEVFSCVDLEVRMLRVFRYKSINMIVPEQGNHLLTHSIMCSNQSHYISGRLTAKKNNQNLNDAITISTTYEAIVFFQDLLFVRF